MTRLPTWVELWALTKLSITRPREAAADILRQSPGFPGIWYIYALMVVLTIMVTQLANITLPAEGEAPASTAWILGGFQAVMFLAIASLITFVGRWFNGEGDFAGALILVTWQQLIFVAVQLVQLIFLVVAPPLATLIFAFSLALFFWLTVNFIAELHGFKSIGAVFVGVILTALAFGFVLAILAALVGFDPTGGTI